MEINEIKQRVAASLPIVDEIKNAQLREKVIEAWAVSLSENGYTSIEEIEGSGKPGGYTIGDQAQHVMCVTRLALAMAEIIQSSYGKDMHIERDMLIAAGLCHDVGKPYEYNIAKRALWQSEPERYGNPPLRHTLYGVYIALRVGLPEEGARGCGGDGREGERVRGRLRATGVHHADKAGWRIPGCYDRWVFPD